MRNNKAILDDAARSVRRTFIGTATGSAVMLVVVGAAGAYGMPERLTAEMLSAAMARFNVRLPHAPAAMPAERAAVVAQNAPMPVSPVSEIATPPVVQTVPQAAVPAAAVFAPQPPPREAVAAALPIVEPAPQVTASLPPVAVPRELPAADATPAFISAPLVFETPKAADAQVLTALPKTELVVAPAAAAANAMATPAIEEFPKSVTIHLPLPKPPLTPAQRLDLSGKDYDKAEKCLAQAIYFEARAEPVRGQQAVAQVVLNRVFSPYYPKDVCSVVYQNAHRHLSCQFTFACDGKPESINERGAWARANQIAKQTLAAKLWLPEVNKATHYHASYVRPNWIREMKVMAKYGLHTFYRPRNWGDGSNEPAWGSGAAPAKKAAKS